MPKKKTRKFRIYELPKLKIKATKLVLACDPGSVNFGIALVGLRKDRPKIYANAVLMAPVNDLVHFNRSSAEFLAEFDQWVAFKPDGIVAERFQSRGLMGSTIEAVGSMVGLVKGRYQLPVKLTVASTWKNKVQRRFGIDLKDVYSAADVQPHQIDACLIGIFGLEEGLGRTLDWDFQTMIDQVSRTSLIGHKGDKHPQKERLCR